MYPLISVCMPCFNAERYVKTAIDSILEQSWNSLEIIVVNDCSTDASELILDSIVDSRERVVHQENRGQCAAANRALSEAQGSMIKFFDADDIISVDTIQTPVKAYLREHHFHVSDPIVRCDDSQSHNLENYIVIKR